LSIRDLKVHNGQELVLLQLKNHHNDGRSKREVIATQKTLVMTPLRRYGAWLLLLMKVMITSKLNLLMNETHLLHHSSD
jgi:hypothetical protein